MSAIQKENLTETELADFFSDSGMVLRAEIGKNSMGVRTGRALVVFEDPRIAERAIADMHDSFFGGGRIEVRPWKGPEPALPSRPSSAAPGGGDSRERATAVERDLPPLHAQPQRAEAPKPHPAPPPAQKQPQQRSLASTTTSGGGGREGGSGSGGSFNRGVFASEDDSDSDEDEEPLAKRQAAQRAGKAAVSSSSKPQQAASSRRSEGPARSTSSHHAAAPSKAKAHVSSAASSNSLAGAETALADATALTSSQKAAVFEALEAVQRRAKREGDEVVRQVAHGFVVEAKRRGVGSGTSGVDFKPSAASRSVDWYVYPASYSSRPSNSSDDCLRSHKRMREAFLWDHKNGKHLSAVDV